MSQVLDRYTQALTEFLFVLLPLVVLTVCWALNGKGPADILDETEWSFATCVLLGQAMVKHIAAVRRAGTARADKMILVIAIVLIFGLVPALVLVAYSLNLRHPVSRSFVTIQMIYFVAAAVVFVLLGRSDVATPPLGQQRPNV
jgi:hypothetical protein